MKKRGKSVAAALITGIGLVGLAGPAEAVRSYAGDAGFSEDVQASRLIVACDTKKDGDAVYAQYYRQTARNPQEIRNNQGAGKCEAAGTSGLKPITRHRINVDLFLRPDPSGPWVFTGY